jgi:hypothetical protein
MCKKETLYDIEDHIDTRYGYIEGAGQLCFECYSSKTENYVEVPTSLANQVPNDMELGGIVRKMIHQKLNY